MNDIVKKTNTAQVEIAHLVMPGDANPTGFMFGGRLMEWIDVAAGIVANRHARRICVTASMDELHFIAPIRVGHIVVLKAYVNFTHKTSLEVGVRVEAEDPLTGDSRHTASAYLTFVAIDSNGKPVAVLPVVPNSPEQKRRHEEAKKRREHRLAMREERKLK